MSSASGPPAKTSPSSPTTASTPCSTAGRSRPASPRPTASGCWSTRTWAWSSRCSTSRRWRRCAGHVAVGHCRYSTTGGSTWENAQPTFGGHAGGTVALAHNGNLINTAELRDLVDGRRGDDAHRGELARGNTTDSDTRHARCSPTTPTAPSRPRRSTCCPGCAAPSASSSWTRTPCTPRATRTASARSSSAGSTAAGWSPPRRRRSTSSARRSCARSSRASCVAIDDDGVRSQPLRRADAQGLRLRVRLPGPPGHDDRRPVVHAARVEIGRALAREHPVDADLVIRRPSRAPRPRSATPRSPASPTARA